MKVDVAGVYGPSSESTKKLNRKCPTVNIGAMKLAEWLWKLLSGVVWLHRYLIGAA